MQTHGSIQTPLLRSSGRLLPSYLVGHPRFSDTTDTVHRRYPWHDGGLLLLGYG